MIFFALACAVSSFSILTKCRYLVLKLRTRFAGQAVVHANVNVNLVSVGPVGAKLDAAKALTRTKSAAEVKAQIEKSAFERRRYTIAGFLALFEVRPVAHRRRAWVKFVTSFSGVQDLPMGTPRLASKLACCLRSTHLCAELLLNN
jgi:hypothetical protein